MNRRTYLSTTMGVSLFALAGCSDSENENESSEDGNGKTNDNTDTTSESESKTEDNETSDSEADNEENNGNSSGDSDTENNTDRQDSDEEDTLSQTDLETDPEAADAQIDSQEVDELEVNIDYTGEWSGIVGDSISAYSIEGSGPNSRTLNVADIADVGSVAVRKRDSGTNELTITIAADGDTVAQDTTTDESHPATISVAVN